MNERSEQNGSFDDARIPHSILELVECFRVGIDDLADPEFAPLAQWLAENEAHQRCFDQLGQLDQQIGNAFRQVTPSDPDRCYEMIAGEANFQPSVAVRSVWRRSVIGWVAGAVAATIVLGLFVWQLWPDPTAKYSSEQLAQMALQWTRHVQQRRDWSENLDDAPDDRAVTEEIVAERRAWLLMKTELDSKTAVYQIGLPQDRQAYLFVIQAAPAERSSPLFPITPNYRTGDYSVGICQHDNRLFVLVVEGSQQDYLNLLRERRGEV